MKFVLFCHSLRSDWNHGNAHFLRGVVSELLGRGHEVSVHEPADGWSLTNLIADQGEAAVADYQAAYPELSSQFYDLDTLDLDAALDGADVVIVHEWNDPALIARVGEAVANTRTLALFHDTHHRSETDPQAMAQLDLKHYDGVLAFGEIIRQRYQENGWAKQAWTWHEAADTRRFYPIANQAREGDLIWIGNWGDDERTRELHQFLIEPVKRLGLKARVHGVRYPDHARAALREAGIEYGGWIANHRAPQAFSHFSFTVHVPRRAYAERLHGIPTIRMFEALACGIPLVSAPWDDAEGLFRPGTDYLVARNGAEMTDALTKLQHDLQFAQHLANEGVTTIRRRHTCAHRVDELLNIIDQLNAGSTQLQTLAERPTGAGAHA
jgi:spore maturation protein CgeB